MTFPPLSVNPFIHCRTTSLPSASVSSSSNVGSNDKLETAQQQREMETIRFELVQKYIALGHNDEYATHEVDYFLDDDERSKQYVEMRRVAMKRGNDFGIEDYIQFGSAFVVGWLGSFALNSWHELQVDFVLHLTILFIMIFASPQLLYFFMLCDFIRPLVLSAACS